MFSDMLERDRRRRGFTVGQVAWRLGVSPRECRGLEAGRSLPTFETWDRVCKLYWWS
jgi:predicted transcriptional regulator